MNLVTKILKFQELIREQTNELPEYYVVDNHHDLRQLLALANDAGNGSAMVDMLCCINGIETNSCCHILGTKILIDIIKEK